MQIIPVIDLKDGCVVSAQRGRREYYSPINSRLCCSSLIKDVVNGFLSVYSFKTIYIADLNAITGTGNNKQLIKAIRTKHREIEFWIDRGEAIQSLSHRLEINYKPVIGTESQTNTIRASARDLKNTILSLDFATNKTYTGPAYLLENSDCWPQDIILMTLDRVGSEAGPDFAKLAYFSKKYADKNFIAAGGIRHKTDLLKLQSMGIHQVLIANALHSGVINAETIMSLQTKKCPD